MKRFAVRIVAVMACLSLTLTPLIADEVAEEPELTDYQRGRLAGKEDADGNGIWILSGLFLGPVGLVLPWIFTPEVPGGSFVGESPDYVEGYQDGYRADQKADNFMYSLLGFGIIAGAAVVTVGVTMMVAAAAEGAANSCSAALDQSCAYVPSCNWDPSCSPTCSGLEPGCDSSGCDSSGCGSPDIGCSQTTVAYGW